MSAKKADGFDGAICLESCCKRSFGEVFEVDEDLIDGDSAIVHAKEKASPDFI